MLNQSIYFQQLIIKSINTNFDTLNFKYGNLENHLNVKLEIC